MLTTKEILRVAHHMAVYPPGESARKKFRRLTPLPRCGQVTVKAVDEDGNLVPGVTPHRDKYGKICRASRCRWRRLH